MCSLTLHIELYSSADVRNRKEKVEEFNKVSYVLIVTLVLWWRGIYDGEVFHLSMCVGESMEEAWNINGTTQVWYSVVI